MFGKRDDPTADWPANGVEPVLDPANPAVGPMSLGDRIDAAEAFGRPERVHGSMKDGNVTLDYPSFELQFKRGNLVCVKFDVDEGSSVQVVGGIRLSRATKPLDAQVWFGEPASDSTGAGGLRWIDFQREGATLALEFDQGALSCVQLYAEGYA